MTLWGLIACILFVLVFAWFALSRRKDISAYEQENFKPAHILNAHESSLLVPRIETNSTSPPYYLLFDTETTDIASEDLDTDHDNTPVLLALSWQILSEEGSCLNEHSYIMRKEVRDTDSLQCCGISRGELSEGNDAVIIYNRFIEDVLSCKVLVAHNLSFHREVLYADMERLGLDPSPMFLLQQLCTMQLGVDIVHIMMPGGGWKLPKLSELFGTLYFRTPAVKVEWRSKTLSDVRVLGASVKELIRRGIIAEE
ncbi:hypothetical protein [Porphyromonas pogonae]|uniref:hypothetical protein n=1 Tax=Porphyromonas pogonae TaxID=867595 RepID=UPI002E786D0E|nr:hypothetical protein [Porphyromonas pogonae]